MIPVFVPSYKRPKATLLVRSLNWDFPLYVFVRKEELEDYSWIKKRPNTKLITLKNVHDIGETRAAMLRYASVHGIPRVFMLDDDVTRLDLSVWDEERRVVRASGTVRGCPENWQVVLAEWESLWGDEALFGASYRPFSWSIKKNALNTNRRVQLQQAVGVNVERIVAEGLRYYSNKDVGNEDLFLQLECYQQGLECVQTPMIQYDCPAMGAGKGGCNASELGSIAEKQHRRVRKFLKACGNDPAVRVSTTRSGVESIKFNWKVIDKLMGGSYE
jgi:hypothetical protein